jgi:hypothetical protein
VRFCVTNGWLSLYGTQPLPTPLAQLQGAPPEQLHTGEYDDHKKGWKRCNCTIVASGTLARKFNRKSTDTSDWEEAKRVATHWEERGVWPGRGQDGNVPKAVGAPATELSGRVTIADAAALFLVKCQNRGIQKTTLRKYQTIF